MAKRNRLELNCRITLPADQADDVRRILGTTPADDALATCIMGLLIKEGHLKGIKIHKFVCSDLGETINNSGADEDWSDGNAQD
jgi:hypothetical protein